MRWNRSWLLAVALLVASLAGGLVTQEAEAQAYRVDIDFALQRSFLIGQDLIVVGVLTVLGPRGGPDTVTATVFSPDPNVQAVTLSIPVDEVVAAGTEFQFAIQQVTFIAGDFSIIITSTLEGILLPTATYPAPNYDVDVAISAVTGEVGAQFLITTTIDVGNMSEMQNRFDIEYVLDGVSLRQSTLVTLFGDVLAVIVGSSLQLIQFPQPESAKQWGTTQTFVLSPGSHTLTVNVIDLSLAEMVLTETFNIQVSDPIAGLETRVDELDLELGAQIDELSGQNDIAAQAASAANTLAGVVMALALVAIGLSVLTLLIQFGILRLGRFRRGPPEGQEPEEPQE